jgi:hypothetical protein
VDKFDYFGTATNLSISLMVTVYGMLAWAGKGTLDLASPPFKRRAYLCWLASWLAWVFAWATILAGSSRPGSLYFGIPVLAFDNLNSIFLILVFLTITRGDGFGAAKIGMAFACIAGSLGTCTCLLYVLSRWLGLSFAYEVHRTWSLCLGVISPILVGWAFNLRFNTLSALAVGFVYGFIQPVVYTAEVHSAGAIANVVENLRPVTAMTLAGLKVTWAIVFMQILALGVSSGKSLVQDRPVREFDLLKGNKERLGHARVLVSLDKDKPTGESDLFKKKWNKKLLGQALMLVILYTILLICMFLYYSRSLERFGWAVGIVASIIGLLQWFWDLWDKATKRLIGPTPPQAPPLST